MLGKCGQAVAVAIITLCTLVSALVKGSALPSAAVGSRWLQIFKLTAVFYTPTRPIGPASGNFPTQEAKAKLCQWILLKLANNDFSQLSHCAQNKGIEWCKKMGVDKMIRVHCTRCNLGWYIHWCGDGDVIVWCDISISPCSGNGDLDDIVVLT